MMKRFVIVAALVAVAAGTAHADDRTYLAAGIASGAGYTVDWLYAGPQVEAGYHATEHWWLHGEAAVVGRAGYGTGQDFTLQLPKDNVVEARVGFEARCTARADVCWFAGGDAGAHTSNMMVPSGLVIVPRAGLDLRVSEPLHVRLGAEVRLSNTRPSSDAPFSSGIGAMAAVLYMF